MKAVSGVPTSPLEGLPHPESRHTVLTKLETNEYVLRVPRGGKSVVWKIFLNVTNMMGIKIDFVLCRYCCGLFMYKGYASGTSSLMNHGIRCLDRPKNNEYEKNNGVVVQEEWPDAFKAKSYFTLNYLKRFKIGDTRSPSPVSPATYSMPFGVMESLPQGYSIVETAANGGGGGGEANSPPTLRIKEEQFATLQHFPLYTALHVAAQNFGLPIETLLKLTDGLTGGGGQRSMLQEDGSDMSSGGGAIGGSSVGLSGIEAVVAAAAAAAAAAGETSAITAATSANGAAAAMPGPVTVTSVTPNRAQGSGVVGGMSPPSAGPPTPSTKPESYQLRHNNHLSLVLNQLAEDEAFMDVTLTAEGRPIKAHKSVLSAVSPYFSSVLRANPCQHPIIIMPRDIRYTELSNIIMYIYKGEMTVSSEDLPSLLKTAELLRITGLSPGENQQHPVPNKPSSGGSTQPFTGNFASNSFNATVNSNLSGFNNQYNRPSSGRQHQQQQQQQAQQQVQNDRKDAKSPSTGMESPTSVQAMLNPSDFMDLDMTCVKEEMNSDDDQDDNDATEEMTSREVTTPPAIQNPLSSSNNKHDKKSPAPPPNLEAAPDEPDQSTPSESAKSMEETETTETDADLKRNSLKTLASLANLDTPTNLSPSNSASPSDSSEPSPNVCPYCTEYITGSEMSAHLSSKHAFKPAFPCDCCARVYTRKSALELHTKSCSKES